MGINRTTIVVVTGGLKGKLNIRRVSVLRVHDAIFCTLFAEGVSARRTDANGLSNRNRQTLGTVWLHSNHTNADGSADSGHITVGEVLVCTACKGRIARRTGRGG